jgi:hypothetical protein
MAPAEHVHEDSGAARTSTRLRLEEILVRYGACACKEKSGYVGEFLEARPAEMYAGDIVRVMVRTSWARVTELIQYSVIKGQFGCRSARERNDSCGHQYEITLNSIRRRRVGALRGRCR